MIGWNPDVGPGLDSATEQLRGCELTVAGRLPWSSNLTFLVTLESGHPEPLSAVYKPARGEQSLWDFPDGLYRREVAAFALSEALGWGMVPPTVERHDGPFGPGSLQLFVEADYAEHYFTLFESGSHEAMLRTMCAFDIVANNADRKSGHCLWVPGDRIYAIDHGLTFHAEPKLRTVIWDFGQEPIAPTLLEDLRRAIEAGLPDALAALLDADEQRALKRRARGMIRSGHFPVDQSGLRYPWPLV